MRTRDQQAVQHRILGGEGTRGARGLVAFDDPHPHADGRPGPAPADRARGELTRGRVADPLPLPRLPIGADVGRAVDDGDVYGRADRGAVAR